jgi:hypothetical protein
MESAEQQTHDGASYRRYMLSWLAYIRPVIFFLVLSGIGAALSAINQTITVVVVVLALALLVYQVLYLRSIVLYTDDVRVSVNVGHGFR